MTSLSDLLGAALGRPLAPPANLHGNAIHVIAPYKHHGMWVFDDPRVGLHQEPFVGGADDWIDRVTADIPGAADGYLMVFSAQPFPGAQFQMERRPPDPGRDMGGTWYWSEQLGMEGWLCSALFRYFAQPPERLHVQVKPRTAPA